MSASTRSARSVRSSRSAAASPSRGAQTRPGNGTRVAKRPDSRSGAARDHAVDTVALASGVKKVASWIMSRRSPFLPTIVAAVFLIGTLLGTLALRTQMVEDSFEATRLTRSINNLRQDAQGYQSELDRLEAQLPVKAQELGMGPQQGSISIDLNGYQPPADSPELADVSGTQDSAAPSGEATPQGSADPSEQSTATGQETR